MQRYRAFRDEVRIRHVQIPQPFAHVIFVMPLPQSWSQKKKSAMEGMPHQSKPDRDNLEKALLDSVFGEDCSIWDGRTTKVWGKQALIIVSSHSLLIQPPFLLSPFHLEVQDSAYGSVMKSIEMAIPCVQDRSVT